MKSFFFGPKMDHPNQSNGQQSYESKTSSSSQCELDDIRGGKFCQIKGAQDKVLL